MAGAAIFTRIGSTARVSSASRSSGGNTRASPPSSSITSAASWARCSSPKSMRAIYRCAVQCIFQRVDRARLGRRFREVPMTEVYRVGYLERLPLGTPYPGIVAHIGRLLGRLPAAELVIDFTGVGRPVFDMFRFSGITPTGVLITAGTAETGGSPIFGVPKLDLVSRLQALLHEGRLKIHKDLAEAETLVRELQDFAANLPQRDT